MQIALVPQNQNKNIGRLYRSRNYATRQHKKESIRKGENGKRRKRNRTCGRRQHKNSVWYAKNRESAHVNHVVGGSAARSLCTKQTNYRTPLPTAAPLARVALLLSGRRRPPLRRLPPALAPLCAKFSLSAAAAASSERQTIRQTPALPCLPAWPPWKIVSPQNSRRALSLSPASVCVCAACASPKRRRCVCALALALTHARTPRTHSPFDPALSRTCAPASQPAAARFLSLPCLLWRFQGEKLKGVNTHDVVQANICMCGKHFFHYRGQQRFNFNNFFIY